MPTKDELTQELQALKDRLAKKDAEFAAQQALLSIALTAAPTGSLTDDQLIARFKSRVDDIVSGVQRSAEEIAATTPAPKEEWDAWFKVLDEGRARGPETLGRTLLNVALKGGMAIATAYLAAQTGGAGPAALAALGAVAEASSDE